MEGEVHKECKRYSVRRLAAKLLAKRNGQTLVEYGLIIALLVIVVIGAVAFFGKHIGNPENNSVLLNALK